MWFTRVGDVGHPLTYKRIITNKTNIMNKEDVLKRIENAGEKVIADLKSLFEGLKAEVSKGLEEVEARFSEARAEADAALKAAAEAEARMEEETDKAWRDGYERAMKDMGQFQGGGETEPANNGGDTDTEPSTAHTETDGGAAGTGTESEYCLTNERVSAFMAHEYPAGILTAGESVVDEYISRYVVEENYPANLVEHPLPVELGTSKDDVYLKGGGHVYQGKGGQIWNLVPGRTYEGTVGGKAVKFRTTGTVRQIHFEADSFIPNCRDIGGYKCEGGGMVKYGRIIQSAKLPTGLKKDSSLVKILQGLMVTCEIDLRGEFAYDNLGWRGYKCAINGYKPAIMSPSGYKTLFERVLKEVKASGCVLLHCHAGADRTGTAVAMLLALLGVDGTDICKNYELACACHWCNFKRISDERFKEFPTGELRSAFKYLASLYGTKGESLQAQAYAWWTKKVGVTAAQIDEFKKAMILK